MADAADALYREALAACEQGRIEDGLALSAQGDRDRSRAGRASMR